MIRRSPGSKKGYLERAGGIPWANIDPKFDPPRRDARFADLLLCIGLPGIMNP